LNLTATRVLVEFGLLHIRFAIQQPLFLCDAVMVCNTRQRVPLFICKLLVKVSYIIAKSKKIVYNSSMAKIKTKRMFTAMPVPFGIKDYLALTVHNLEASFSSVKWVSRDNYHITLQFLGDLEIEAEEKVRSVLASTVNRFNRFRLELTEVSAFPALSRGRVVIAHCQTVDDVPGKLKLALDRGLSGAIGYQPDNRAWQPHITLGRVRRGKPISFPHSNDLHLTGDFEVCTVQLISSRLTPAGPEYTLEQTYELI